MAQQAVLDEVGFIHNLFLLDWYKFIIIGAEDMLSSKTSSKSTGTGKANGDHLPLKHPVALLLVILAISVAAFTTLIARMDPMPNRS